jgi:sortase A
VRGQSLIRGTAAIAMTAGLALVGYVGWARADEWTFQHAYRPSASPVAAGAPAAPAPLVEGDAIGEIHIARLGLTDVIAQGSSAPVLRRAVGHLEGTPWLGQSGNVVLAGHRDTLFRALRDIRLGDRIDVTSPGRHARYDVTWTAIVLPTATDVLDPTANNTLTLITCYPFTYIGAAPQRFIVRATEVSSADD